MRIGINTPAKPKYDASRNYPTQGPINVSITDLTGRPVAWPNQYGESVGAVKVMKDGVDTIFEFTGGAGAFDTNIPYSVNIGVNNSGDITSDPAFGMTLVSMRANVPCWEASPSSPGDPKSELTYQYTQAEAASAGKPSFRNGDNFVLNYESSVAGGATYGPYFYIPPSLINPGDTGVMTLRTRLEYESALTSSPIVIQTDIILVFNVNP